MLNFLVNDDGERIEAPEDEGKIRNLLNSGYSFEQGAQVPIHVKYPYKDIEKGAYKLSADQAKEYIVNKVGSFMTPQQVQDFKDERKYSKGYGLEAAGIGVANALSFGAAEEILSRTIVPNAKKMVKHNPGISLVSDLIMTGGAMALASTGVGAPVGAGVLATKAPRVATALGKMGFSEIAKMIKKAPWKYTAPGAVSQFTKKTEQTIVNKILGEAAEETLEKTAGRGLLSKVAVAGTDALLFSAGYGTVDAAAHLYDGREPGEVVDTFFGDVGTGMLLGAALPTVFHGLTTVGVKTVKGAAGLGMSGLNYAADTKAAREFYGYVAEGAALLNPGKYDTLQKKIDLAEKLRLSTNVEDALSVIRSLVARKKDIVTRTGEQMADARRLHTDIRAIDQAGHSGDYILKTMKEVGAGADGAVSSTVLADLLLNGTRRYASDAEKVSGGFLERIEGHIKKLLKESEIVLQAAEKEKGRILTPEVKGYHAAKLELEAILKEIDKVRGYTKNYLDDVLDSLPTSKSVKDITENNMSTLDPLTVPSPDITEENLRHHKIASILNSEPLHRAVPNHDYNAATFHALEKISSRVHTGISDGPWRDIAMDQDVINMLKSDMTTFLTSEKHWDLRKLSRDAVMSRANISPGTGPEWFGPRVGGPVLTPWGNMAKKKSEMNTLMTNRDKAHELITTMFFEDDMSGMPINKRFSMAKVEDWIETLNHENSQSNMEALLTYARYTRELTKALSERYDMPTAGQSSRRGKILRSYMKQTSDKAEAIETALHDDMKFLTTDMAPALEYAAVLQRERTATDAATNPSLVPYAFGLGIGGAVGGLPGAALGTAAAGAWKMTQEMQLNPGRAMAKLHSFFVTVNTSERFLNSQLDRYFLWLNRAKKLDNAVKPRPPGVSGPWKKRIEFEGPAGKIRYPRLLTSNAIARLVTGGDYEGKADGQPGTKFAAEELKNAMVITKAINQPGVKEALVQRATEGMNGVDPMIQQAQVEKLTSYIDAAQKVVEDVPTATAAKSIFDDPEDILVSDVHAQTAGEKLAIIEYGEPIVLRNMMEGTLTQNEWDLFTEHWPEASMKFRQKIMFKLSDRATRKGLPRNELNMLSMIAGVPTDAEEVVFAMQEVFAKAKEEEEKPGPSPAAKWVEGRFPGTQLAGSYAIEQRRSV